MTLISPVFRVAAAYFRVSQHVLSKGLILALLLTSYAAYSESTIVDANASAAFSSAVQRWQSRYFEPEDALLVESISGLELLSQNPDALRTPASVLKILTALMALERWGADYRWATRFKIEGSILTVIGSGDPFLVSEEMLSIAEALTPKITEPIETIVLETTYFMVDKAPGRSKVNDPYNAPVSALAANFNTVQLTRSANSFTQGEPQTPLTRIALQRAAEVAQQEAWPLDTTKRVNLNSADNAHQNFGELLHALLKQLSPASVSDTIQIITQSQLDGQKGATALINQATLDSDASFVEYTHLNSNTLDVLLRGMLKYSNNFIANQLFLALAGDSPANFSQSVEEVDAWVRSEFSWDVFSIQDGSGLSVDNRLSALQMSDVLQRFAAHSDLLSITDYPKLNAQAFVKTGTLSSVRTLAGYIVIDQSRYRFSYFFNRNVPWKHRELTLDSLVKLLAESH